MISDYGIDYFVYFKKYTEDGLSSSSVFENDSFFVLKSASSPQL